MAASIVSPIATRTLTAAELPRPPLTHPLYDLISPETAEKEKMAVTASMSSWRSIHTAMCHPRERGDPEFPPGQVSLNRSALTTLDARVRGHDKVGSYKWREGPAQPFEKARFAEAKWIWVSFSPAWISFSLGLDFLQPGLEFLQPGLEFLPCRLYSPPKPGRRQFQQGAVGI